MKPITLFFILLISSFLGMAQQKQTYLLMGVNGWRNDHPPGFIYHSFLYNFHINTVIKDRVQLGIGTEHSPSKNIPLQSRYYAKARYYFYKSDTTGIHFYPEVNYHFSLNSTYDAHASNDLMIDIGGGILIPISKHVKLDLTIAYRHIYAEFDRLSSSPDKITSNNLIFRAGVDFLIFFKTTKKK